MLQQPFPNYNGGKSGNGTYQQIINFIPQCEIFIDAMVGNAGIVSKLKLPFLTIINDIDATVINAYDVVQGIVKENMDIQALIAKYDYERSHTFFYFDPPYLMQTRKSSKPLYRYEWDEKKHLQFLNKVVTMKSNCMISHYPCDMYDHYLTGWNSYKFESITRAGMATECLYMNYSKPEILQDYQYIGNDFTDRQRIKRKSKRWVARLAKLSVVERTAILSCIIDKYNYTSGRLIK